MKNFTNEEFVNWTKNNNKENSDIYFVMIKTKNCPKCLVLSSKINKIFKDLSDNIATYTFVPGQCPNDVTNIIEKLEQMSVPIIAFRYNFDSQWKLKAFNPINVDDTSDFECYIDAIIDTDFSFFGYNEYGEAISEDADLAYYYLLTKISKNIDLQKIKEREVFKKII